MIETFNATSISIDEQEDQMTLAVFNDKDDYLFFQCPLEQKDLDSGVYVEFKAQRHGAFDVVSTINISDKTLQVELKSPLFALPDVMGFNITLNCELEEISALAEQLQASFQDRSAQVHAQL